jgi:copper chaperone CopZ
MKKVLGILMVLVAFNMSAQESKPKTEIITIQTSALCGECKERIEHKLNYTKGISFADLNLDNKVLTVKYKTKYLTAKAVKQIVADLGYHAGDVERKAEAFKALPACCRDENASCTKKK